MSQGISDSGNQEQVRIRLYRRLARAYPHEFRMICGDEMERLGGTPPRKSGGGTASRAW